MIQVSMLRRGVCCTLLLQEGTPPRLHHARAWVARQTMPAAAEAAPPQGDGGADAGGGSVANSALVLCAGEGRR